LQLVRADWNTNYKNLTCNHYLTYYANASSWNATGSVSDVAANIGNFDLTTVDYTIQNTTTVNSLVAIDIQTAIDFGATDVGVASGEQVVQIENYGNVEIEIKVNGTDMSGCTLGSVYVNLVKYDSMAGPYGGKTALTGTPTLINAFEISKATGGAGNWGNSFWQVQPPEGSKGVCSGYIEMIAQET
jgi:hypothetical protein